jgi:hypothetical protein
MNVSKGVPASMLIGMCKYELGSIANWACCVISSYLQQHTL